MSEIPYLFLTGATGFIGGALLREVTRDLPRKPWRAVRALVRGEAGAAKARELGAECLIYQEVADMEAAIIEGSSIESLEMSCFTGEYVTGHVTDEYLAWVEATQKS